MKDMTKKKSTHKKVLILSIILCVIIAIIVLAAVWFNNYTKDYYHASESVMAQIDNTNFSVDTIEDGSIVFSPKEIKAGFIFYPGGKVEYKAYAPLMERLADNGILCIIVKMPYNLAVLNKNAADTIKERYPGIDKWYIGGHSLGGSMAASYASQHSEDLNGVIMLAAYSTADISDCGLSVLSIYGTEDKILNTEKFQKYLDNLPDDVQDVKINGGCHSYFGDYSQQDGDGTPTISRDRQLDITSDLILKFIEN